MDMTKFTADSPNPLFGGKSTNEVGKHLKQSLDNLVKPGQDKCKYCDSDSIKSLYDWNIGDGQDFANIWIEKKNIEVEVAADGQMACETSIPVKYCPMCGRRLGDQLCM